MEITHWFFSVTECSKSFSKFVMHLENRILLEMRSTPFILSCHSFVYFQVIPNITRKYHDGMVKCEVHNAVGKSEESEALDISCKYNLIQQCQSSLENRALYTMYRMST